ncbi:hypothetical protein DV737_g1979, partial [Chaetothyriales sp. CBS 132003]
MANASPIPPSYSSPAFNTGVAHRWFNHSNAARVNTDITLYLSIKSAHPDLEVTIVPIGNADLKSYAARPGSDASIRDAPQPTPPESGYTVSIPTSLSWLLYSPPAKRLDGGGGGLTRKVFFESYLYRWSGLEFLVYYVDGRDGSESYPQTQNQYIVSTAEEVPAVHTLITTVGRWMTELHDAVWVFDRGRWQQDASLYASIQKAQWGDIILDHELKEDLLATIQRFFSSRDYYKKLRVPWKRGLIFHGPPGNGKTVSLKATMHTLYERSPPVPTLYVKSLVSFSGPEHSISQIFSRARREAPCFLVFEDLDSMITPAVRSFFLNAVDGLSENKGILMVGSTNHLNLLDPGLSKRPSRFDRKYLFPDPNKSQRVRYCEYWQRKLKDNEEIKWPDILNDGFARIMVGFSFAYMQEAFVSALLELAGDRENVGGNDDGAGRLVEKWELLEPGGGSDDGDAGLEKYLLYRKVKEQVDMLRKEMSRG